MWVYEKRLQFPINIKETNAKLAQDIISQYGGPDGEMSASMRYLSQRYSMPDKKVKAALTDIGTEELAHLEMVATIIYQLTRDLRKNRDLPLIISTTPSASGPRRQEEFHLTPANSSARATR